MIALVSVSGSENVPTMKPSGIGCLLVVKTIAGRDGREGLLAGNDGFDFPHRDHRQEADEQEKAGEEEPEASDENADVENRRIEHAPARRQKRTMQRHHDDDEPFEPHPDVDENRHDEKKW